MSSIIWSRLDLVAKITVLKFQEIHLGSYEDWWLKQRWLVQEIGRELHLLRIAGYPQNGFVVFCRRAGKRDLCKKHQSSKATKNTSRVFDLFWRVRSSTVDPWSMPNIPLPSSRYCPFGEVSCKFHQPHHALPYILFAYLGRRVEQSINVLSIATCHNHDFPSPAVEAVFLCILLDVEQRQRK